MPQPYEFSEFPPADVAAWQARAEEALASLPGRGVTSIDGIGVPPVMADDARPGACAPLRSLGVHVGQEVAVERDPAAVVHALADLGVHNAWVRMAGAVRAGCAVPVAEAGAGVHDVVAIADAATRAGIGVVLEAGAAAADAWQQWCHVDPEGTRLRGVLGDPWSVLGELGARGSLESDALADLAALRRRVPDRIAIALASAVPLAEAGAGPVRQIGWAVAQTLAHVESLTAAGISIDRALRSVIVRVGVGTDVLVEIAKLRALRALLLRLSAHHGVPEAVPTITARTLHQVDAAQAPDVNLVRRTLQAFAAVVGGADVVDVQPHGEGLAGRGESERRWAANVLHVLIGESHLSEVLDPCAGSPWIESLTEHLARAGWQHGERLAEYGLEPSLADAARHPDPPLPRVGVDLFPDRSPAHAAVPAPPASVREGGPPRIEIAPWPRPPEVAP